MQRPRRRRRARLSALRRQSRPNRQAPELSAAQLDAIDPGFGRRCLFVCPFDGTAELAPRAGCSNIWHRSPAYCRTSRRPVGQYAQLGALDAQYAGHVVAKAEDAPAADMERPVAALGVV